MSNEPLREAAGRNLLAIALDAIIALQYGRALCCCPVTDPDQLTELQKAKSALLELKELCLPGDRL